MSDRIYHALLLAEQAHRGQLRKGLPDPYIVHPIRVARAAATFGFDDHVQAAALLHDVPEDTATTLPQLALDLHISTRTFRLVTLLTKWWPTGTPPNEEAAHKSVYYDRILQDAEATALKIMDRTHNVQDALRVLLLPTTRNGLRRWVAHYAAKTALEFSPLLDALVFRHMGGETGFAPVATAFVDACAALDAAIVADAAKQQLDTNV